MLRRLGRRNRVRWRLRDDRRGGGTRNRPGRRRRSVRASRPVRSPGDRRRLNDDSARPRSERHTERACRHGEKPRNQGATGDSAGKQERRDRSLDAPHASPSPPRFGIGSPVFLPQIDMDEPLTLSLPTRPQQSLDRVVPDGPCRGTYPIRVRARSPLGDQPARMQRVSPLPLLTSVAGNAEKPVPLPTPRGTPVGNRFAPVRMDALLAATPILGIVEPARRSTK